jgi:hypothetical protein
VSEKGGSAVAAAAVNAMLRAAMGQPDPAGGEPGEAGGGPGAAR